MGGAPLRGEWIKIDWEVEMFFAAILAVSVVLVTFISLLGSALALWKQGAHCDDCWDSHLHRGVYGHGSLAPNRVPKPTCRLLRP